MPESSQRASLFRTAITDQNGSFKLSDMVPGAYTLYAWDQLDGDAWFNEEFMKKYASGGEHVRLDPSGSAAVQLQVMKVE